MNRKSIGILFFTGALITFLLTGCSNTKEIPETQIQLSESGITVTFDGKELSTDEGGRVHTNANIVYYESGKDSTYGEGTEADEHDASEAEAHTVVTITEPGTYRISGTLPKGQIAVDLGEDANEDPEAVVTLILDGADISCTVAPAVIFYNVYECGDKSEENASPVVDTSAAGANVVIADGTINHINGSYVARIYEEGTTDKLHKYDGAFYSKRTMNLNGESEGTGELYITAENEGLNSELHLTINGGNIFIESQDDGINTNEDFVSVTTINGGYLYINAGLGSEGDGIDSNGYLTINGGTVSSFANGRTGDGGIDADSDILLNGGTVLATGSRNDAVSADSIQPFMELSFATTKVSGEILRIEASEGTELLTFVPRKDFQSLTYTSADLAWEQTYQIYVGGAVSGAATKDGICPIGCNYSGGTLQQYTGNSFGMGRPGMGGQPPGGFEPGEMPERMEQPEDGGQRPEPPEGMEFPEGGGNPPEMPEDSGQRSEPPEGFGGFPGGGPDNGSATPSEGSTEFLLTKETHSFSGISDGIDASGKTAVIFTVNGGNRLETTDGTIIITDISAITKDSGEAVNLSAENIQITITDIPSEDYSATGFLSDGMDFINGLFPEEEGTYQLTISVDNGDTTYTGTTQIQFSIKEE